MIQTFPTKYPIRVTDGTVTADITLLVVPVGFIGVNGIVTIAEAIPPVFGKTTSNIILQSDSPEDIEGLLVEVETGFYQCEIWILCDRFTASPGDINNNGTAIFNANLVAEIYDGSGSIATADRPTDFETSGGLTNVFNAGQLLTFTGTIEVTTAGRIVLQGKSVNAPDAFTIAQGSTIGLTRLGD